MKLIAVLGLLSLVPSVARAQTSISIYGDGRAVVRTTVPQALTKGRNALVLELDGVDPAAIFSPDSSVAVVSAVLRSAADRKTTLQSAVGQTLSFVRAKGDTVRATVVRVDPPIYRLADGRMLLVEPGEPLFPSELVRGAPQVSLVLEAARPRPATDLAYVTQGASWRAVYQVVLPPGAGQAAVSGAATVTSQALRAENAEVQLVAGVIARAQGQEGGYVQRARMDMLAAGRVAATEEPATEQAVGEAHVYTLPAKLTLEPGVATTTALFPRALIPVTQELIVPGVLPWRGYLGQAPEDAEPDRVPVQVWYVLKRSAGTAFGDRPLPGGTVQVYQPDSAGRVQLLGEATSDHTAPGRDLRVQAGEAFDITVERVQTDYTQEQLPPARRGLAPRQRVTASYRVKIDNAKATPVSIDVREAHAGTWLITASSVPAEKLSSTQVRFRLTVPAKGSATLTYTVQADS